MEGISRQPNVDLVVWLLLICLAQVYSEKWKVGERNSYNIQFGKDKITRTLKTAAEAVLEKAVIVKEISSVKEKPPTLH